MTGELRAICMFFRPVKVFAGNKIMACSHRGGEPQADWAPHLVEITRLVVHGHINSWSTGPGNPLRWGQFSSYERVRWGGGLTWLRSIRRFC